jgi:hypothetical protein
MSFLSGPLSRISDKEKAVSSGLTSSTMIFWEKSPSKGISF